LKTLKAVKLHRSAWLTTIAAYFALVPAGAVRGDAVDRLQPAYLRALHEATESFRHDRQAVSLPSAFTDYRAAMHVHSLLSHDSRATVDEIIAAAKKVGVKVILFTEHPAPPRDYFKEGHRGMVDGVLLIPAPSIQDCSPSRSRASRSAATPIPRAASTPSLRREARSSCATWKSGWTGT
jgi:hypothetical protein